VGFGFAEVVGFGEGDEGFVGPEAFVAVVAVSEVADEVGDVFADLGGVAEGYLTLPSDGGAVVADNRIKVLVVFGVDVFAEALQVDGDAIAGGVGEVFVEGAGEIFREREGGVAGYAVVDVVAKGERQDEGGVGLTGVLEEGFVDLGEGSVGGIDGHVADDGGVAVEAQRGVFDIEVDHDGAGDVFEEVFVLALAHGGDVGEAVVLVDGLGVGVGGVEGAGEDVDDGDGVAVAQPGSDGQGEGEGGVVSVGGEDDDVEEFVRFFAQLAGGLRCFGLTHDSGLGRVPGRLVGGAISPGRARVGDCIAWDG
jgi:hypothetical protein